MSQYISLLITLKFSLSAKIINDLTTVNRKRSIIFVFLCTVQRCTIRSRWTAVFCVGMRDPSLRKELRWDHFVRYLLVGIWTYYVPLENCHLVCRHLEVLTTQRPSRSESSKPFIWMYPLYVCNNILDWR